MLGRVLTFVAFVVVLSSCAYDWTVGDGGAGSTASSTSSSKSSTGSSASSSSGTSSASGASCAVLVAAYDQALLAAKRCTMTDVTACQASKTDGCNCKVFLAHASSAEAADFEAKKSALAAAGCSLGCTTCPVGPVIGSCAVDLQHGGTSCTP